MDFWCSVVVLRSALPHSIVGRSVSSLHVVDQILDESDLILSVDDLQARSDHLHQEDDVDRDDVDLEMVVLVVRVDLFACVKLELAVQGVSRALPLLEHLDLVGLLDPALQNASHSLDCALTQLVGLSAVIVDPSVGLIQTPYRCGTVNCVTNTTDLKINKFVGQRLNHRASSYFFISREDREQPSNLRLMLEELPLHDSIVDIELLDGLFIVGDLQELIQVDVLEARLSTIRFPVIAMKTKIN
jgi:hypothetical protein